MNIICKILFKLLLILILGIPASASFFHLAPKAAPNNINEKVTQILVNSLKQIIKLIKKNDIIYFIGSGDGKHIEKVLNNIKDKKNKVYIIDISSEMLQKCEQNLSSNHELDGFEISYIKGNAHDIKKIVRNIPEPNVIFALDVLTNIKIPVDAVESLLSVLNKIRGVFCAYYPASASVQPNIFHKYFSFIFEIENKFHKRFPDSALTNAKENRYYNPSPVFMKNKLGAEFHVFRRRILIIQTIFQLINMVKEEDDYIKKFFVFTRDSYSIKLFYFFIKHLQNSKIFINSKTPAVQINPFNIPIPRYWNVLTIVPKTIESNYLFEKYMPKRSIYSAA